MAKRVLEPGLQGRVSFVVEKRHLACEAGSGDTRVFSTPMLVAGMEEAAVKAVEDCLDAGMTTVGAHIDVFHRLPTVAGKTTTFEATLEKISPNGKGLLFRVEAHDEQGRIGDGSHERVIVNRETFEKNAFARCESLENIFKKK